MKKPNPVPAIPHSSQAEQSVLGAIMLDREALYVVAEILCPDDFFSRAHQRIFSTMLLLEREGSVPDLVTLGVRLDGDPDVTTGYLASLVDGVPRVSNVEYYSREVKEKSQLRSIIRGSNELMEAAFERNANPDQLLERWQSAAGALREEQLGSGKGAMPLREIVRETTPVLERVSPGAGMMLGTPTGFVDLDHKLAGWVPGNFVVLAGRPSAGKTALCLEFVRHQAKMGNHSVIFGLEMSRTEIVLRLACREAGVDSHRLRQGYLSREEWARLSLGLGRIAEFPVWIDDRPAIWAHELRWRLRSLAQRHAIKLAVVDYLQLLRAKGEGRTQQVTEISLELKAAARELGEISGGTLIAVSQLSRIPKDERPQLHHLRESGQIEQDADAVLFIWDAEPAHPGQADPWTKQIDIAKQRNGPTGNIKMVFLPRVMGFEPLAHIGATEPSPRDRQLPVGDRE